MTSAASLPSEAVSLTPSDQITLTEIDRSRLYTCIHTGRTSARVRTRAQVLLKLGDGWSLADVCRAFDVCRHTAVRVRTRFQEGGVEAVLTDQRQEHFRQALTGPRSAAGAPHRRCLQHGPGRTRPLDAAHARR
jgi:hypothetical protein